MKNTKTFKNPILSGFYPDPSICRVGEDYYMVTSSFVYFPGLPVFHSRDLVHWEQIGHAIHRPEPVSYTHLSDAVTKEDLERFREYEAAVSRANHVEVITYVICSAKIRHPRSVLRTGINLYRVKTVQLKRCV